MRRALCIFWLTAAAAMAQLQPAPPVRFQPPPPVSGKGVIQGTVVDVVTHEPLKKAQVNLGGPVQFPGQAVTDASGRFVFRELPAGSYFLSASKSGYSQQQGVLGPEFNLQITLGTDEQKKGLEIGLVRATGISGRVVDEDGQAVRNCSVNAADLIYDQGRRQLRSVGSAGTNDKGEYRIAELPKGRYYLFANCYVELVAAHPLMPRGDPRTPYEIYMPQFYGGGTDLSMATRLAAGAGTNLEGVDFQMRRSPGVTLHGRITGADAAPLTNVSILLSPTNPLLRNFWQLSGAVNPEDRTFQIRSVIPGSYTLTATVNLEFYAQRPVEIGATTPEPVEMGLSAGMELKGSVHYDTDDHPPLENGQIWLMPIDPPGGIVMQQGQSPIGKDGGFTLTSVMPGHWRLMIGAAGYIKSLTMGDQAVSPYNFQVLPGSTGPLRVIMGSRFAEVNVSVSGAPPDRQVTVMAYPEELDRLGAGLERNAMGTNRVELQGIQPGRYRLLATDAPNPWNILQRPDLLKALEGNTQSVEVPDSGRVNATVDLVSREDLLRVLQEEE